MTRLTRLIQLNAKTDEVLKFAYPYDDEENGNPLLKAAAGTGLTGAAALGGLYAAGRPMNHAGGLMTAAQAANPSGTIGRVAQTIGAGAGRIQAGAGQVKNVLGEAVSKYGSLRSKPIGLSPGFGRGLGRIASARGAASGILGKLKGLRLSADGNTIEFRVGAGDMQKLLRKLPAKAMPSTAAAATARDYMPRLIGKKTGQAKGYFPERHVMFSGIKGPRLTELKAILDNVITS